MEKNIETKECVYCHESFSCGASDKTCWCMAYDVSEAELIKIRKQFNDCLCEKCLIELTGARKK